MNYVGCDLHKETTWFYILDKQGKKLISKNISNKPEKLKSFFKDIPKPFTLAVESTYNWYFFVDLAEKYADKVYLANPYELKAFAKRHKKTDKIDARLIAGVLYKGYLPIVTIAGKPIREMRELLRLRMKFVTDRSRNIFRLKNLLDKLGFDSSGNFTAFKHLECIHSQNIPKAYMGIVDKLKDQIIYLSNVLYKMDKDIITLSEKNNDIVLLMTLDGISHFSGALIYSEIIDINRFKSLNRLCAYAGLAPRVIASANKLSHGPINKNRCKYLQWILLETVHHFIRGNPKAQQKFDRIKQRKGYNTAKVALARDYLKIIYRILREKKPYYREKIKIQSVGRVAFSGV